METTQGWRTCTRRRIAFAALALVLCSGAMVANATAMPKPGNDKIDFAVDITERASAAKRGVKIYPTVHAARGTVVYSVKLDDAVLGEKVRVAATVHTSACWTPDITSNRKSSPCQRKFNHTVHQRLRLYQGADGFHNTDYYANPTILETVDSFCPFDRHHCPVTLTWKGVLDTGQDFLNIEMIAWKDNVRPPPDPGKNVLELGADCTNKNLSNCAEDPAYPTKGQLGVARRGSLYPFRSATPTVTKTRRITNTAGLDERLIPVDGLDNSTLDRANPARRDTGPDADPVVVESTPVSNLQTGDVIETDGRLSLRDSDLQNAYDFKHLVSARWVLSSDPQAWGPSGTSDRRISGQNGENCEVDGDGCRIREVGGIKITGAMPQQMYLNLAVGARDYAYDGTGHPQVKVRISQTPNIEMWCSPPTNVGTSPCGW